MSAAEAVTQAMRCDRFQSVLAALGTLKLVELVGIREACAVTYGSTWRRHSSALRAIGLALPERPANALMAEDRP